MRINKRKLEEESKKKEQSNMSQIPNEVLEFARLHHIRRQLLDQANAVNKQLGQLHQVLLTNMQSGQQDVFELNPRSEDEFHTFGGAGQIKLKTKSEYEALTRENLVEGSERFFRYIMPEASDDDIRRVGRGAGEYIWKNRQKNSKMVVERVYAKLPTVKRKEPRAPSDGVKKVKVGSKSANAEKYPTTQAEFMAFPSLKNLMPDN